MANNRTLSQSGDTDGPDDFGAAVDEQAGRLAEERRYLVGYDQLETLDETVSETGRIVRTASLDTLGRAAVVDLPEPAAPELVSTAGIEFVLDLDHL